MHTERTTTANAEPTTAWYADADTPSSAVEQAYRSLKRELLHGAHPIGLRLAEERLARDVGVSRTPMREALLRLHTERLICRYPGGGYAPAVPNIAEVRELYEVRAALESAALLRPTNTGRPHDAVMLIGLRERWSALSAAPVEANPEFVILDEQFHVRLAEASENRELAAMLQHINERIRIVRMRDFLTVDRVVQTIAEHLGLLELVIEGRLDEAVSAYGRHVATSLEVVEQRVAGALMGMVGQR